MKYIAYLDQLDMVPDYILFDSEEEARGHCVQKNQLIIDKLYDGDQEAYLDDDDAAQWMWESIEEFLEDPHPFYSDEMIQEIEREAGL